MEQKKERILYYDILRVIACFCVLTIHFNASFSGYSGGVFAYPNSILPNCIFNQSVYLGDFGVSLFLILSGASIFLSYQDREVRVLQFYKKRFFSLFPMYYLAWFAATGIAVLVYGGISSGKCSALIATALGMDGYLLSLGYSALGAFYQVGEWYLGCIVLLCLIMPLLLWGAKKYPIILAGISVLTFLALQGRVSNVFFLLRLPEVVFGMLFSRYFRPQTGKFRGIEIIGAVFGMIFLSITGPYWVDRGKSLALCIFISMLFFVFIVLLFQNMQSLRLMHTLSWLSKYTYPAFLVHHQVCDYMARRFYLPELPKGTLFFTFLVYLVITGLLSVLLYQISRVLMDKLTTFSRLESKGEKISIDWNRRWRRGLRSIPIVALLPIQFFGTIPLQLYQANTEELKIPMSAILLYCATAFALSLIILLLVGILFSNKWFSCYCAALFSGGVMLYLQSNFLFIKVGILNGQNFDGTPYQKRMQTNLLLWLTIILIAVVLAWKFQKILNKITQYGSLALSAMQCLVVLLLLIGTKEHAAFIISTKGFDELSSNKNTVIIIMDMFDDTYMTEVLEKNPDIEEQLDGFVRYTNVTGKYSSTCYGVPYIVTQHPLVNQGGTYDHMMEEAYNDSNQLNQLIQSGYRMQLYTEEEMISDTFKKKCYNVKAESQYIVDKPFDFCQLMMRLTLLRAAPDVLKNYIQLSTDQFDNVVLVKDVEAHTVTGILPYQKMMNDPIHVVEEPVFSVIHIRGAHYPYAINENVELVEENSITYYEQSVGTMRAVEGYLQHMRDVGVYDNSTVILTADHGYYNGGGRTCPVLLVKEKNKRGEIKIDNTPVSHADIEEFVLGDAGLDCEKKDRSQPRMMYTYNLSAPRRHSIHYLTEWYIDNKSNSSEMFTRSGYYIDLDGNRNPLSRYTAYNIGDDIRFGLNGNGYSYFDYGLGDQSSEHTRVMESESKLTFSHNALQDKLILNIEYANMQDSEIVIEVSCNGIDCGEWILYPGNTTCQFILPEGIMNTTKSEVYLKYKGMKQDPLSGAAESLLYHSMWIKKYDEKLKISNYIPIALSDFQSEILSYEFSDNDLFVRVKNTSSANWTYQDRVRCYIRLDEKDSGIRAELSPDTIVRPGEDYIFRFIGEKRTNYPNSLVEVQMLQEGFAYFGEIMKISSPQ